MTGPDPIADIAAAASAPRDAPDLRGDAAPAPADGYDEADLGTDCPVSPLGYLKQRYFFLDHASQLIELGTEFRKGEVIALFGEKIRWLENRFPQHKEVTDKRTKEKEWIIDGFNQKEVQRAMIIACAKRGLFDPIGRERGRGAHRGDDGEIVLHCGSGMLVGGKPGVRGRKRPQPSWHRPGLLGRYVYPNLPALEKPADAAAPAALVDELLDRLETWRWKNGAIDAYLMLCWLGAASLGGALRNRPHLWITGPSGAGKTSLQRMLRDLMGDWAIATEDATEAGVRQLLNQDTLAVMFDEIEPDDGNSDVHTKIVKLARLAYSGSSSLRGTQNHESRQFVARSCFLFSSIHHHELPSQDRNRMAILHLTKFPPKTPPLTLPAEIKSWGAMLRRRLVEQWHRYDATLDAYQMEMLRQGYSGREQDTYGTLLACGDLLTHDSAPDRIDLNEDEYRCAAAIKRIAPAIDRARAEAEDTSERCVRHLASHRLPARGGEMQENVARWVGRALIDIINRTERSEARSKLAMHGMKLVHVKPGHEAGRAGLLAAYMADQQIYLAVAAKNNKAVQEIYAGSMWQNGVWMQALALLPGAFGNKKVNLGLGSPEGCTIVPVGEVVDLDEVRREAHVLAVSGG
ncbi:hypothetical protein ACMT1E_04400 [Sphingomonas flavalba]|uniref:hypothetical protein n=1 Tax=Sphingomonas flavalba TaxID=2559804 RepID=UPI0039E1FAA1